MKELHCASWERRGKPHSFSGKFFEPFHRLLIERSFDQGGAQLLKACAGDRVLGYLYNFQLGNRVYAYQSGFDDCDRRERPGIVTHFLAIRHAFRSGARVQGFPGFEFAKLDVADRDGVFTVVERHQDLRSIIHLAAQAGVRYSLENPYAYIDANITGTLVILEAARRIERLTAITYASSSSVYGANRKQPFSVDDRVDQPVSLYAATKRSCELIAHTYGHLYGLPATGLRFFTVYGPWGRPDMAAFLFTRAIPAGEPIKVFNEGRMARDFTYINDIVAGTIAAHNRPPTAAEGVPHRIYNLGNHRPEKLLDFIPVLERELGRPAEKTFLPLQHGDLAERV